MADWESFLSTEAKLRVPHETGESAPKDAMVMSISAPNKENFPLRGVAFTFQTPESDFKELKTSTKHPFEDGVAHPEVGEITQYLPSSGLADLNKWIRNHITRLHKPQFEWDVVIHGGSTHSLDCIFRTLMDPNEDTILADEFTYTGLLGTCAPLRLKVFPVKMKSDGVDPADMDRVLTNWETDHPGVKKPKAYYAMPTGHNPTGLTMTLEIKKGLLEVAKKHNMLIIEDDVFYHLNLDLKLPPSLLELDDEGRVLRIDSFSKMLMPGMRVSMVSCNPVFHSKLTLLNDYSIGAASPPSQLVLTTILEDWGAEGFESWLLHINEDYKAKRDNILKTLDSLMPQDLVDYTRPEAGMIVWFSLRPEAWVEKEGVDDWLVYLENLIHKKTIAKGVSISKGHGFMINPETQLTAWRVTYSFLTLEEMRHAISVFAEVIKETYAELYN